jgi:hypothetical protein
MEMMMEDEMERLLAREIGARKRKKRLLYFGESAKQK